MINESVNHSFMYGDDWSLNESKFNFMSGVIILGDIKSTPHPHPKGGEKNKKMCIIIYTNLPTALWTINLTI